MAETPTLYEAIMKVVESRLHELHTWMPCIVESYDEAKQLVDVTPQVKVPYFNRDTKKVAFRPAARIPSCPVGFMGAGGFRITLPIIPGKTTGVLLTSSGPLEQWLNEGPKVVDPFWPRRHHINDSMFIPMLKPDSAAFTDVPREGAMTAGKDGGPQLVITNDEVQLGGTPSSPPSDHVALSTPVKDELTKLRNAMNAGFSDIRTAFGMIASHEHAVSGTAASASIKLTQLSLPTQGPQDAAAVGDVKASVTKAK